MILSHHIAVNKNKIKMEARNVQKHNLMVFVVLQFGLPQLRIKNLIYLCTKMHHPVIYCPSILFIPLFCKHL